MAHAVAVVHCPDYGREECYLALKKALDLIGDPQKRMAAGEIVALKPNILVPSSPDKYVTTHPDVLYAVARVLKEQGLRVIVTESPGAASSFSPSSLRKAYETTGYAAMAEDLGIDLNLSTEYVDIPATQGRTIKRINILKAAVEADHIIGVSKMKTHVLTGMTGAVKNLFGLIPGLEKATYHARLPEVGDFASMLVDIELTTRPAFHVMDAVMAMEGDGPHAGTGRRVGLIIVAENPHALDVVASQIAGFDLMEIPTIREAAIRGLVTPAEIHIVGLPIEQVRVPDFRRPVTKRVGRSQRILMRFIKPYAFRPNIVKVRCIGCGRCEGVCPKHAISMMKSVPRFDYRRCIRCYCCHEMCPEKAITLRRSGIGRLMARLFEK